MLLAALGCLVAAVLLWPGRSDRQAGSVGRAGQGLPPSATGDAPAAGAPAARSPRRATGRSPHGGLGTGPVTVDHAADALVLCALVLRSGLGPVDALEAVADRLGGAVGHQLRVVASAQRWGQDAATAWAHVGPAWAPAALAWQAAERSGAAPAGVLLAAAERMRRAESSRVEAAVQRAGVLLVLPLGACFLPGFAGTTVVPVVLHLARSGLGLG